MKVKLVLKGGSGSGNFGHAGRPGEVGGSEPGEGGSREAGQKIDVHANIAAQSHGFTKTSRGLYTKTVGNITANVKVSTSKSYGKSVGETIKATFEDRDMKPGYAHEPIRYQSFDFHGLDYTRIFGDIDSHLQKLVKGMEED